MDINQLILEALLPCYNDRKNPKETTQSVLNWHKKEVQYAKDFLIHSEVPKAAVPCHLASKYHQHDNDVHGLLFATNKRIFFVGKTGFSLFGNAKPFYREFRYESIGNIEYVKAWALRDAKVVLHVLTTSSAGNVTEISFSCGEFNNGTQHLVDLAHNIMADLSTKQSQERVNSIPGSENLVVELERLAKLKEQNAITDEEFATAKKKLLAK